MAKLPRLTGKRLGEIISRIGFVFDHQTGSHLVYRHSDGRTVVIPYHSGEEIGPGLLNKIIKKDLGLTRNQFLRMLK
ncbi:MAG: type II toxin-antitoxin system HicA family toxin [Candidatus Aenigmarchaeota archaeon]|nr:type II toxin-antitoxin system HicA family toxin [Candidatus Aenigmarchaeota archaeon]